jgi:hypothetical protein
MLQSITWNEYLGGLIILLIFYYLFVGARYYREEIKTLLKGKLPKKSGPAKSKAAETGNESFVDASSFDELETVVNDLRYAVLEKADIPISKQELLIRLQERLAHYQGLQKQAYRVAINNFIIIHAEEICGVVFNEHELNSAWDKISKKQ